MGSAFRKALDDIFKNLREFRCPECRHLLFKEWILIGKIEIKCGHCGQMVRFLFKKPKRIPNPDQK